MTPEQADALIAALNQANNYLSSIESFISAIYNQIDFMVSYVSYDTELIIDSIFFMSGCILSTIVAKVWRY